MNSEEEMIDLYEIKNLFDEYDLTVCLFCFKEIYWINWNTWLIDIERQHDMRGWWCSKGFILLWLHKYKNFLKFYYIAKVIYEKEKFLIDWLEEYDLIDYFYWLKYF